MNRRKEYYFTNKNHILSKTKEWRLRNIETLRRNARIGMLRVEQKRLAVEMLENLKKRACDINILLSPPTILHYQLLPKPKSL